MKWISEHSRSLRLLFLILLVIATSGPWFFDRILVPSSYTCSAPNIRLDDDFCGLPLSITYFYFGIIGNLPSIVTELVTGTLSSGDFSGEWRFYLFLFLLSLPVLGTAILILRGDHRRWQILHTVGLGLAAGIVGWIAWSGYSRASWMLWGLWLYIGLTISMWVLEVLILRIPRKLAQE